MRNTDEQIESQCVHWRNEGYAELGELEYLTNAANNMHTSLYKNEFISLLETIRSC